MAMAASLFPYPLKLSTKPFFHYSIICCPKNYSLLDSIHALTIETANEAFTVEGNSLVFETNIEENIDNVDIFEEKIELALRRKQRRKRRRCCDSECLDIENGDKLFNSEPLKTSFYLTHKEDSEYSWYLKV